MSSTPDRTRLKILFLHKQILFPRDTGGKIRVLNLLQHLARWHDVTYVCNLRQGEEALLPQMAALGLQVEAVPGEASPHGSPRFLAGAVANLASPRPYALDRNYDVRLRNRIEQRGRSERYHLAVGATVQLARHTIGLGLPATIP